MSLIVINEDFIDEKHLSWNVKNGRTYNELILEEIVIRKYRHPQAPTLAFIEQIEVKHIKFIDRRNVIDSCHVILLENALENVTKIEKE